MFSQEDVEFKTVDGIILRGCVYRASARGPGIILSPGFNCVKEMLGLPEAAKYFQKTGITALIYDPRSTGRSDGTPRNNIDPMKQVEDYSDAFTFLSGLAIVDPSQIAFWGMSFSGAVSLCSASLDKRAKLVIAICPLTDLRYTPEMLPRVLAKCMKDRESQLRGNPPYYLPVITESGENPAGFGIGVEKERYAKIVRARKELAPSHVNQTTIQSYYNMLMWQPSTLWRYLDPTPVLFLVPELDSMCPADVQLRHFEQLSGPKRSHVAHGRNHMDILQADDFSELMELQTRFIHDVLEGRINQI